MLGKTISTVGARSLFFWLSFVFLCIASCKTLRGAGPSVGQLMWLVIAEARVESALEGWNVVEGKAEESEDQMELSAADGDEMERRLVDLLAASYALKLSDYPWSQSWIVPRVPEAETWVPVASADFAEASYSQMLEALEIVYELEVDKSEVANDELNLTNYNRRLLDYQRLADTLQHCRRLMLSGYEFTEVKPPMITQAYEILSHPFESKEALKAGVKCLWTSFQEGEGLCIEPLLKGLITDFLSYINCDYPIRPGEKNELLKRAQAFWECIASIAQGYRKSFSLARSVTRRLGEWEKLKHIQMSSLAACKAMDDLNEEEGGLDETAKTAQSRIVTVLKKGVYKQADHFLEDASHLFLLALHLELRAEGAIDAFKDALLAHIQPNRRGATQAALGFLNASYLSLPYPSVPVRVPPAGCETGGQLQPSNQPQGAGSSRWFSPLYKGFLALRNVGTWG